MSLCSYASQNPSILKTGRRTIEDSSSMYTPCMDYEQSLNFLRDSKTTLAGGKRAIEYSHFVIRTFVHFAEHAGNITHEQRLLNHLLEDYKNRRLVRPVMNRSEPIIIKFSAELIGVAKVVRRSRFFLIKEKSPFLLSQLVEKLFFPNTIQSSILNDY